MITRYGPCWGLTLFRWGQLKVELWFAPADYSPAEHSHDDSDCEFTILYSKNRRIYRKTRCMPTKWPLPFAIVPEIGSGDEYIANTPAAWGKWLSVRAGVPHRFETGDSCMVWLCVQRWKPGVKVTSITQDFNVPPASCRVPLLSSSTRQDAGGTL